MSYAPQQPRDVAVFSQPPEELLFWRGRRWLLPQGAAGSPKRVSVGTTLAVAVPKQASRPARVKDFIVLFGGVPKGEHAQGEGGNWTLDPEVVQRGRERVKQREWGEKREEREERVVLCRGPEEVDGDAWEETRGN